MLRAILNKSWKQHCTKQQLYGYIPPITKTIKVRRTRHAVHCWRSRDKLISDVLLWTPSHDWAKAGRPARTYLQQLWVDTGCIPKDLPEAMNVREGWRERVRDIRADGTTRWWWWIQYQYTNQILLSNSSDSSWKCPLKIVFLLFLNSSDSILKLLTLLIFLIQLSNFSKNRLLSISLHISNKILFLRKISSWPRAALDLARVEKGEVIPESVALKIEFLFLSRTTIQTLSTNSGTEL